MRAAPAFQVRESVFATICEDAANLRLADGDSQGTAANGDN
jgi:hypothetical protein